MRWERFEVGIETHAKNLLQAAPIRLAAIVGLSLILGLNFGVKAALEWVACAFVCEAWSYLSWRIPEGINVNGARRANRLLATFASSLVWTAMAAIYWWSDSSALDVAAIILLTTMLINAQSMAANSLRTSLVFGLAPTVSIVIFPFTDGFQPAAAVAVLATAGMSLSFLVLNLRQSIVAADALRAAKAELLAGQVELKVQTAQANAANEAKSAFLAMMSHELRTPMNGVLGMAQALRLSALDARQARHVDMLVRSGDGLMTILNDILDISKIEAGKLEIESIAMDLPEVAHRVHELWSEVASAKGVRLVCEVDPSTPQWVAGDPVRLRQVMTNLVSNALKFTSPEGTVELHLRTLSVGDRRADLEILVRDTGIGMTEQQVAGLFQSFSQADVSTTRKFGGTGLGLAICKQLVELMGGTITVESQSGVGSTFRVSLSMNRAEPAAPDETAEDLDMAGVRLLVVDDNPINLAVAQAILEATGAVISTAADGLDALEVLKTEAFDVVLMDVHMPRLGGVETLARIRAGEGGIGPVPVIALSADAMEGVDRELLAKGFDAVQPKPIQPAALLAAIASVLSASRADAPPRRLCQPKISGGGEGG